MTTILTIEEAHQLTGYGFPEDVYFCPAGSVIDGHVLARAIYVTVSGTRIFSERCGKLSEITYYTRRKMKAGHYNWYIFPCIRIVHPATGDDVGRGVMLHRIICQLRGYDINGYIIDHKNHNGLDNSASNLRVVTYSENNANKRKTGSYTSQFHYVSKTRSNKWLSRPTGLSSRTFSTEEAAAIDAYKRALANNIGTPDNVLYPIREAMKNGRVFNYQ